MTEEKGKIFIVILFAAYLLIGLLNYRNYGMPWDALENRKLGLLTWEYLTDGKKNPFVFENEHGQVHGPVFELYLIFIEKIFKLTDSREIMFSRYLNTFLIFYLGVIVFYKLCAYHFGNWQAGLWGSLFLILTPRIFAHSFYNSLDIPFMAVSIIGFYYLFKFVDEKSYIYAFLCAVFCAILTGIRNIGIAMTLLFYFYILIEFITARAFKKPLKNLFPVAVVYAVGVIFVTILYWPFLWDDPVSRFLSTYTQTVKNYWPGYCFFLGKYYPGSQLPWNYVPVWMLITIPPLYTFFFMIGLSILVVLFFKKKLQTPFNRRSLIFMLFAISPVMAVIILKSTLYTDWRHLYFIYPSFIVIALTGLMKVREFIQNKFQGNRLQFLSPLLLIFVISCLIHTAYVMIKIAPYQFGYFNIFAGKNIKQNFEIDHWGLSYRPAIEYILAHDPREEIKISVLNHPGKYTASLLLPDQRNRLEYVEIPEEADYFLTNFAGEHLQPDRYQNKFYSLKFMGEEMMAVYIPPHEE